MLLLIDWGNTFLKYMLIETPTSSLNSIDLNLLNAKLLTEDLVQCESLSGLDNLPKSIDLALVCSVKSKLDNKKLSDLLDLHCHQTHFAKTSLQACGISCAYTEPQFLGVDRWLSIIAAEVIAAESIHKSIGVISIGTAITLDLVVDKQHLGGHIIPGKSLMLHSLLNTGQVRPKLSQLAMNNQDKVLLGQSTTDCVDFGIDSAILGYLLVVIKSFANSHHIEKWVICGGGARSWANILKQSGQDILLRQRLIFEGLIREYIDLKTQFSQ